MEKAFDKMNRDALFIKMMNKGIPLTLINLLEGWFNKSFSRVRWGSGLSAQFAMRSGTRQGGVLSPILFSVFIDDVLHKLEDLNCGCIINNICLNSFLYADDLILLAISLYDMSRLLDVCREELDYLDMRLNVKKSSAIRIGSRWDSPTSPLQVGGQNIPWVQEIRYLGIVVVAAKTFQVCSHNAKIRYFQSLNSILGRIGDMEATALILSLTATNCLPILMYALEACHLSRAQIDSLTYAYNAVFVKIFKTFDREVIRNCQFYSGILPATLAYDLGRVRFLANLRERDDSPAGFLWRVVGSSELSDLCGKYGIVLPLSPPAIKKKFWEFFQQDLGL